MTDVVDTVSGRHGLPRSEGRSLAFWGVVMLAVTEGMLFVNLLFSYYYLWSVSPEWPPAGVPLPALDWLIAVRTVALLSSSASVWRAERALARGDRRRVWVWTTVTVLLGAFFLATHVREFVGLPEDFLWSDNAYGSLYYTILNIHGAHVAAGLAIWGFVLLRLARGAFGPHDHTPYSTASIYWHVIDVLWVFVFGTVYVFPHLLAGAG